MLHKWADICTTTNRLVVSIAAYATNETKHIVVSATRETGYLMMKKGIKGVCDGTYISLSDFLLLPDFHRCRYSMRRPLLERSNCEILSCGQAVDNNNSGNVVLQVFASSPERYNAVFSERARLL
jgi:hypothetical protein